MSSNPELFGRIDEFFFEHHVTVKEMLKYWGQPGGSLADAYEVLVSLRQKGVRAHWWP